jgi:hypothetical protein
MSNQGSVPPSLDPASLYGEQEKRDELKLRTYNNILEQVHNKIRIISRMPNNDKSYLFVVPEFVVGVPRFNTRDCIVYLVWNLRNSHFEVQYFHPNLLWISWRQHEAKYREERNPIVQTMKNALVNQAKVNDSKLTPVIVQTQPKAALKKTTQQYIPTTNTAQTNQIYYTPPSVSDVKKVTFI